MALAGAEFTPQTLPGDPGEHYVYPAASAFQGFAARGFNLARLPVRWERLQHALFTPLDPLEMARLDAAVAAAANAGQTIVIDLHNYGRYDPPGGDGHATAARVGVEVPAAALADVWSRLAARYVDRPHLVFGLMNEPHGIDADVWIAVASAAAAAIRHAGASQLILVGGTAWSGSQSWFKSVDGRANAEALLDFRDPADHWAVEIHHYPDAGHDGTDTQPPTDATGGAADLARVSRWLTRHDLRGFLGEWAVAAASCGDRPEQIGDEAILAIRAEVERPDGPWLGWCWWAAGPWWPDEYGFDLTPNKPAASGEAVQLKSLTGV